MKSLSVTIQMKGSSRVVPPVVLFIMLYMLFSVLRLWMDSLIVQPFQSKILKFSSFF